ncbi:SDR family oxidoreductase [Mycobacterium sp.]|uniref:SDR family oxidoreductase n=1 Tax=Mycobacterium sp. TaxID=1785 RepID=UPI00121C2DB1|nr:MAG: SDR family oxidoreductase [Mycobacterium sp.]
MTGGTKGIGLAIARLFVSRGARAVGCGRGDEAGRAVAAENELAFQRPDVTNEDDVNPLVAACYSEYGGLNILVNNADPIELLHPQRRR